MDITIYTPLYYVKITGKNGDSFAQNMNFKNSWDLLQDPHKTLVAFMNIEGLENEEITVSSLRKSMDNVWLVCPGLVQNPKKYFEVLRYYYFNKEKGIDAAFDFVFGCDSEDVFLAYEYGQYLEVYTEFWSSMLNDGIIGNDMASKINVNDKHRIIMSYYDRVGKALAWQTTGDVQTCQELTLMGRLSFEGNKFVPIAGKILPVYKRIK